MKVYEVRRKRLSELGINFVMNFESFAFACN